MTVIIGVKINNGVLIGSDTRVTIDDSILRTVEMKIVMFNGGTMAAAAAGIGAVTEALVEMSEGKAEFSADTKSQAMKFTREYYKMYNKLEDSEDREASLLICTGDKVWFCPTRSEAYDISTFWGIGSGAAYAMGRMEDEYHDAVQSNKVEELLGRALTVACKYDTNCGEPYDVIFLGGHT